MTLLSVFPIDSKNITFLYSDVRAEFKFHQVLCFVCGL